jgi:hypothetical protein
MNRIVTAKAAACLFEEVGQNLVPCLTINFELVDEPGHFRRWNGWLTITEKYNGPEKVMEALRTCGFVGYEIEQLDGANVETCARLLPNKVSLVLEDQENPSTGKVYETIKWINRLNSSELSQKNQMKPGARMAMAAAMKNAAMVVDSRNGTPAAVAKPAQAARKPAVTADDEDEFGKLGTPGSDDDFPF